MEVNSLAKFILPHPEGRITASGGTVLIQAHKGRCRELVLDQHFVGQLSSAENAIDQFLQLAQDGLAYELMFGETPTQAALDGQELPNRSLLTIRKARGDKFWFGYASRPTGVDWRYRRRLLVSGSFLDLICNVSAEQFRTSKLSEEDELFWLIRGKLDDGIRGYSFNSVSALVEFDIGRRIGVKREDVLIWENLADMASLLEEAGPGALIEGFVPDEERPDYTATIEILQDDEAKIVLFWGGIAEFEDVFSLDVLAQVSFLMEAMWPTPLFRTRLAVLQDDDNDDDDD